MTVVRTTPRNYCGGVVECDPKLCADCGERERNGARGNEFIVLLYTVINLLSQ